ncbi:TlpA disulfide reductase family protein [Thermomonospora umbrina]|uniref:AhpC/TSA family protein n=1 Tax=Thermomonospora umbrina TaxID=111806 RepID=A0A3D9SUB0_9ACTN|nr:TlpA disulfide reductase family protein [Thermomonospora umbrina]REE96154.1 AhpC/TSA family protein [Thermomonospora umbrina]
MSRSVITSLVLVVGLTAAACGSGDEKPVAGGGPQGSGRPTAPAKVATTGGFVPTEFAFTATTLRGGRFQGSTLARRPVVLWFWSASCAACLREGPTVAKLARHYGRRIRVVGVAGRTPRSEAARFVARTGTSRIEHIDDRSLAVHRRFNVRSSSTFIFVRADGSMTNGPGPMSVRDLARMARILLKG